tara:strand:+ start:620 stop:994 length:375 start_codon:yes stop_codon:yes gene_type:complete
MPKPQRKVSHFRRILETNSSSLSKVSSKNLIKFVYNNTDSYDRTPMVFVTAKVKGKYIEGFNINYLKEFFVQRLLLEKNIRNLKYYDNYKHSFRRYKINMMNKVESVVYETDEMRRDRREQTKL